MLCVGRRVAPILGGRFTHTLSFEDEYQKNYVQLNLLQKTILTVGSAAVSIFNPYRGDMIACLSETTGLDALKHIQSTMLESPEGTQILQTKPRINSKTVDLKWLEKLPDGTLGKTYSNFLNENNVTPDTRGPVEFIDDFELAYVLQRYREVHDIFHTVLGMPTNMLGEVTVKWVEAIQTKLPMCISGAIFGPVRLQPKHRQLYRTHYLPWAIETGKNMDFLLNLYFEKRWEQPIDELCREINVKHLELKRKQL